MLVTVTAQIIQVQGPQFQQQRLPELRSPLQSATSRMERDDWRIGMVPPVGMTRMKRMKRTKIKRDLEWARVRLLLAEIIASSRALTTNVIQGHAVSTAHAPDQGSALS